MPAVAKWRPSGARAMPATTPWWPWKILGSALLPDLLRVPEPDRAVLAAGQDVPAVGGEGRRVHGPAVVDRGQLGAGRAVDHQHDVPRAADGAPAVGGEGEVAECRGVRARMQLLARLGVPEPQEPVVGAREQALAVGREGQAADADALLVPDERPQLPARVEVPLPDLAVGAAGDRPAAVGREDPRPGPAPVPEPAKLLARLGVPEPHGVVLARREDAPAVRRERDALHRQAVPLELADFLARPRLPEPDRPVAVAGPRDDVACRRARTPTR